MCGRQPPITALPVVVVICNLRKIYGYFLANRDSRQYREHPNTVCRLKTHETHEIITLE